MHLIEIDHFRLQTAQAVLTFLAYRSRGMVRVHFAILIPAKSAFCKNVRPLPFPLFQGLRHNLFGVPRAINRGGVNPIHSQLKSPHDRRDRVRILLAAPRELPSATTNGPRAKSHARYLQIGIAQLPRLHKHSSTGQSLTLISTLLWMSCASEK